MYRNLPDPTRTVYLGRVVQLRRNGLEAGQKRQRIEGIPLPAQHEDERRDGRRTSAPGRGCCCR